MSLTPLSKFIIIYRQSRILKSYNTSRKPNSTSKIRRLIVMIN